MELFKNTNFDFLGKKWPFIGASLVLTVAGLASLALHGGPRYGIDFRGGAQMYVRFATEPPIDKLRAALKPKIGDVEIVPVTSSANEVIVSTEARNEQELNQTRQVMDDTLAANFGRPDGTKLDFNTVGQATLADRLRGPIQAAGGAFNEQQLQDVAKAMLAYRDSAPRSGLVRSVDELSSVPGVTPPVMTAVRSELTAGSYAIKNVEVVGPKVGKELQWQAIKATLLALAGMLVYIAIRFEWIYGVAAVVAVFHDTIITIGLFSLFNKEISLTVVAALLTLVGYSMNDTIVVFDRIRENLKVMRRESLTNVINLSVNQTLSRTVLTSGLTLLTALALWLFGGPVLNGFAFALVCGIIVGTYSSIFVASPILVFWQDYLENRKRAVAVAGASSRSEAVRRGAVKTVK